MTAEEGLLLAVGALAGFILSVLVKIVTEGW